MSIGTIFSHVSSKAPTGAKLLSGQTLAKSNYTEFYEYINNNKDNIRVISNDDYEAELAKYKFCGAFVISENDVRLPTLNGYISLGDSVPVVGNGIALGLTDGVNYAGMGHADDYGLVDRQAIYGSAVGSALGGNMLNTYDAVGVTTDPTKSGLIVDTSDYPKDGLYWYIQVYNSTYTPNNVEAALKDLSNVDNNFDFVISSGTDAEGNWYRLYRSNWIEQGGCTNAPSQKR
jgi:hypothetical protein